MTLQCGKIIGEFPGGVFLCTLDQNHKSDCFNRQLAVENIVDKLAKKRREMDLVWRAG